MSDAWLDERALRYLDRFDASVVHLKRVLSAAVRRITDDHDELALANERIDALVTRLQQSGVVDDVRFAGASARGLRSRGGSTRMIRHRLRAKGVAERDVHAALESIRDEGSELDAAREFVRRKRLGPHRPPREREARFRRDLAALARAGFDLDVARRALDADGIDDELVE